MFQLDMSATRIVLCTKMSHACKYDSRAIMAGTVQIYLLMACSIIWSTNPHRIFFSYSPYLTWRDVQHIIVNSARRAPGGVPLSKGDWVKNRADLYVSKFYGFGLMDVEKMVSLAKNWKHVPPQLKCEIKGDDTDK